MAGITYWPIANQKFPWLTDEEAKKIESYTSWLTWYQQLKEQSRLYEKYINYKTQNDWTFERVKTERQMRYMSTQSDDPKQSNYLNNNANLEELVDMVADKYHLNKKTPSEKVFNQVVKYAQDKWKTESLQNYLNNWDREFLYEMWLEQRPIEKEKTVWDNVKQVGKDVIWGTLNSFSKDFAKAGVNATAWAMDKLWVDEQTIANKKANAMNTINNLYNVGQDEDSLTYKGTDFVWDIAQMATWEWIIKWGIKQAAKNLPLLEKLSKVLTAWWDLVEEFPVLWKLATTTAKKAPEWVADTIIYNAVNWEWTDTKEMWEWAAINTALWVLWRFIPSKESVQKTAKRLEVWWLLDKNKLTAINNQLNRYLWNINEEWKVIGKEIFNDIREAWEWLLTRQFKWDKEWMAKQLADWANTFIKAKDEMFKLVENKFVRSDRAVQVIDNMLPMFEAKPLWNEEYIKWLKQLQGKTEFNAKELDNIISLIDDKINMFNTKWELTDKIWPAWWANVRRELKEQVEKIINEEWVWDIAAINNEIQNAASFYYWITWKLMWEIGSDILPTGKTWVIKRLADMVWFEWFAKDLANTLAKYTWMERTTLLEQLQKNWTFNEEFLRKVIPESKRDKFMSAVDDLMWKTNKSTELAPRTQLVPKSEKKWATKTTKSDKNTKWDKLSNLIRQMLLVWTEELADNEKE